MADKNLSTCYFYKLFIVKPSNANPAKWSNTLKQFFDKS